MTNNKLWLKNTPIAHRGLHSKNAGIPENSLAAFQAAIDKGYAIELDILVTLNNMIVVFHDYDLEEMCGIKQKTELINDKNHLTLKLSKTEHTIPLLQDVFKLVKGRVPILVEIKRQPGNKKANQVILNALTLYKYEFAVQSFDPFIVNWFTVHAPNFTIGQLCSDFKNEKMNPISKFILKKFWLNKKKPDFVAYNIDDLPKKHIQKMKDKGIPILGWTVQNAETQKKAELLCDNIIFENFEPMLK